MFLSESWKHEPFRRHFIEWWDRDYSWQGLSNHERDYERLRVKWTRRGAPTLVDFAGRSWTLVHLPPFDKDGNQCPRELLDQKSEYLDRILYGPRPPMDTFDLEGAFIYNTKPHEAQLLKLDISKAKALRGVISILTAEDIPGEHNHGLVIYDWPVMVGIGERVRYVGDAIAIVAAETQQIAEQALALIEAEFDLQTVITNPVQARQENVPQLHEKGNLLKHIKVRKGDIDKGFVESEIILEHTFHTPTTDHPRLPCS